jgi:hypothetical protein
VAVNIALFDNIDQVAADAGGALDRARQPSLYARLDWFRLLHAHCPPEGRLAVLRGERDGRSCWLFLAIAEGKASAYGAWYSLRYAAPGDSESDVMTSLARDLRKRGIVQVSLAPVEEPAPLREAFREAGWAVFVSAKTGNWRVRTEGQDFAAYWAGRPGQLRNTVKRKAKAAGLEIHIHDRFDGAAWADYEAVYGASWKPEEGSFAFLRALAEQEGAAGTLRLGLAYKDGRPVAAQLWTIENGEATIHKLAYAEDAKALSPGTILGEAMFRRAIDTDRVRLIDYGTGDDAYKRDWMEERHVLWQVDAYDWRRPRGLMGAARALVGRLFSR